MGPARVTTATLFGVALAGIVPASRAVSGAEWKDEKKVDGYAEFKHGDTLMVDGQRVVSTGRAAKVADIPLGYEVKVTGRRDPSGVILASKVESKPNKMDGTEQEILAASDQAEKRAASPRSSASAPPSPSPRSPTPPSSSSAPSAVSWACRR